nr:hypothetical protein HK105_000571 [Polyrhizophydium stewartii]
MPDLGPEFARAVRSMPKGVFKEDEKGIHVDFMDLFRKQPQVAGPGEIMELANIIASNDDPVSLALFWGAVLLIGVPLILGMIMIMFGLHRKPKNLVPATSSILPFGVTLWYSRDPLGLVLAQTKKHLRGFTIPIGFTEFTVFGGLKKASYAHGFKVFHENVLVSGGLKKFHDEFLRAVMTRPEILAKVYEAAPRILRARLENVKVDEPVDLFQLSGDIAARILLFLAIGERLYDENDDDIIPSILAADRAAMTPSQWYLRSWSPTANAGRIACRNLGIVVVEELELIKEKPISDPHLDLLHILHEASPKLSAEGLVSHINLFVFGNFSDLANTVAWTLYHLIKDPSLKQRTVVELKQQGLVPLPESLSHDVLVAKRLPILTSVVKEVGRLYSPLFQTTGLLKKQSINNYDVYFCDIFYDNPTEFDPSRFLDAEAIEKLVASKKYVQFHNAKHAWFDPVVAETVIKAVILPVLVAQYDIRFVDSKLTLKPSYHFSMSTPSVATPALVTLRDASKAAEASSAAHSPKTSSKKTPKKSK